MTDDFPFTTPRQMLDAGDWITDHGITDHEIADRRSLTLSLLLSIAQFSCVSDPGKEDYPQGSTMEIDIPGASTRAGTEARHGCGLTSSRGMESEGIKCRKRRKRISNLRCSNAITKWVANAGGRCRTRAVPPTSQYTIYNIRS